MLDVLLACVAKCLSVQVKYKDGARKVQRLARLSDTPLEGVAQPAVWRGHMTASVGERVLKLLHDMSEVGGAAAGHSAVQWVALTWITVLADGLGTGDGNATLVPVDEPRDARVACNWLKM